MLKVVSQEVIKFTPPSDRNSEKPTIICFKQMSKKEYDSFLSSLTEIKRNKVISHADESWQRLCEKVLYADTDGVFIYNGIVAGKVIDKITNKQDAIGFLCNLSDQEAANEIDQAFRGQSSLNEDEVKN